MIFHHIQIGIHVIWNPQLTPGTYLDACSEVLAESFHLTSFDVEGATPPTDDRTKHCFNKEVISAVVANNF